MEPFQKAISCLIRSQRLNFELKWFGEIIGPPPVAVPIHKISPLGSPHTRVKFFDQCWIFDNNLEYAHYRLFASLLYCSILWELRFKRRVQITTNGLAAFMH